MTPALHYRIVGSGPVALACALFMVRGGIDPARLSLHLPAPNPGAGPRRMLAISDGSRQLLSRVVAMPAGGVIERIEVAMSGRGGRTRIEARDFDVAALGYVVAYADLVSALRIAAERLETAAADPGPGVETVTIHADGLPRGPGAASTRIAARDFGQAALLTEVMAEHAGTTAYECFTSNGPLALLPCGPGHSPRYAVVWCDRPEVSAERAGLTADRLSAAITQAAAEFDMPKRELGSLTVCAPVEVAPLSRLRRVDSASGREVWIGNAAQALHPVAGQGLNLGLRDAFELAGALADNEFADVPLGIKELLARFAAARRTDRAVTTGLTDLLAAAFGWPLARPLQSALLTAMDLLPALRRPLSRALLFGRR